jgi:hypothetical protein
MKISEKNEWQINFSYFTKFFDEYIAQSKDINWNHVRNTIQKLKDTKYKNKNIKNHIIFKNHEEVKAFFLWLTGLVSALVHTLYELKQQLYFDSDKEKQKIYFKPDQKKEMSPFYISLNYEDKYKEDTWEKYDFLNENFNVLATVEQQLISLSNEFSKHSIRSYNDIVYTFLSLPYSNPHIFTKDSVFY